MGILIICRRSYNPTKNNSFQVNTSQFLLEFLVYIDPVFSCHSTEPHTYLLQLVPHVHILNKNACAHVKFL